MKTASKHGPAAAAAAAGLARSHASLPGRSDKPDSIESFSPGEVRLLVREPVASVLSLPLSHDWSAEPNQITSDEFVSVVFFLLFFFN